MPCKSGKRTRKWVTGPLPQDPNKTYVNPGTDEQMEIEGYRLNKLKQAFTYTAILITAGLLRLVFYWCPHWMIRCTHTKCSLAKATSVVLKDQYQKRFVAKVFLITRDGTQVKIVNSSPKFTFSKRRNEFKSALNDSKHDDSLVRYMVVKKVKYVWDPDDETFQKLKGLEEDITCSELHNFHGLSYSEQSKKRVIYGTNSIAIHVKPIISLLFKEALSPFYVFQAFSTSVWFSDEYEIYAACIVLISCVSIITTIYQTRKMQRALRNTIQSSTSVNVCRGNDEFQEIPSEDLVPGDVIEIPRRGCVMQCDAVLLTGNCIVNESMLTGESVPVTKTPLPNTGRMDVKFTMKDHAKHVLFCGTHVIQTRYYGNQRVRAVVIRTGFSTSKGELVRSILYPKPVDFKFEKDTYIFVGVLALIAGLGFIYTVVMEIHNGEDVSDIILHSLDLITIAVPPALPAALTVGIVFAQSRLKKLKIYCISPRCINVCGSINAVCFDKTGTLTEDGLMMQGVVPVNQSIFAEEVTDPSYLDEGPLLVAMATCHSLTIIEKNLSGDPLDLIMFNSTGWKLEEPGQEESRFDMMVPTIVYPDSKTLRPVSHGKSDVIDNQYGVVRQFTFSSNLQRMSVVVRKLDGHNFDLYTKGAPELIASLCKPETVPENFHEFLSSYTQHGYRVIALAWKPLSSKVNYVKVQRMQRDQVEKDLTFLGLLVLENRVKPETAPVIDEMREANIRCVMVTGDNMLTSISVARECGMIDPADHIIIVEAFMGESNLPQLEFVYADDRNKKVTEVSTDYQNMKIQIEELDQQFHFAVNGKSWATIRQYFPDMLSKVVVRGTIFARMSPEQKAQLIEVLQDLGYYVGMCGDGANDCGALKMAHAGISLSEAEASVASPFTSKTPDIRCVPNLIRQGRAALVTSYGIFKYMACYSLTQFVSVCMLYWISASLTDFEFLYIDLLLLSSLSITFGRAAAYPELAKHPPPMSLTSLFPILSLIGQMAIQIASQLFCFLHIQQQPWFEPFVENDDDHYMSYENTAVFCISAYQYIALAVTFSKGAPYRKNMFTNYLFLINVIICLALTLWITIYPEPKGLAEFLELKPPELISYRLIYLGIGSLNFLASIILEMFVFDNQTVRDKFWKLAGYCFPMPEVEYLVIEREIVESPNWPPLSPSSASLVNGYIRLDSVLSSPTDSKDYVLPPDTDNDTISLISSTSNHRKSFQDVVESRQTPRSISESSSDNCYRKTGRSISESSNDNGLNDVEVCKSLSENTFTREDSNVSNEITSLALARTKVGTQNQTQKINEQDESLASVQVDFSLDSKTDSKPVS